MSDILDYFPERIVTEPNSGCWLWIGTLTQGYGRTPLHEGTRILAHRLSWEISNARPIPDDRCIDHLCCVKACVNPTHLEAVTLRENIHRYLAAHLGVQRSPNPEHCING